MNTTINLSWILQTITLAGIGVIAYFMKTTMANIADSIKHANQRIDTMEEKFGKKHEALEKELNDLKSDLPFVYVLREDFIRVANSIEKKLDNIQSWLQKGDRKNDE